MRKRPPPFTLVLSALVAAAALAIVLVGRGSSPHATGQPPALGSTRACVTTGAQGQSDDRSAIVIAATAEAPVSVTEHASGPSGAVAVTRGETVTARVDASEPVEVKRTSTAQARACAEGDSSTAARTTALRAAYAHALVAAHALASRQAFQSLEQLIHRQYPAVLAEAKSKAAARARQLALAAEASLAAQARAQALRQAGD